MSQQTAEQTRTETFTDLFRTLTGAVEMVVKGKRDVVQLALLALLSEGHVLLEDAPGVGKTTIGKAKANSTSTPPRRSARKSTGFPLKRRQWIAAFLMSSTRPEKMAHWEL